MQDSKEILVDRSPSIVSFSMYTLYPIFVLLLWTSPSNQVSKDLTYAELEELDANCHMLDSCNVPRTSDSLKKYTCQCGSYCSKLETCCIDSPFRGSKKAGQSQICRPVNGEYEVHFFMVDQCSPHNTDIQMETLCKREWNAEGTLLPIIPVTSTSSNVTYKNYFCFRCNEATDDFLYWNVRLNSNAISNDNSEQEIVPTYDTTRHKWMASIGENNNYVPVELFYEIPHKIRNIPHRCITNIISSCSEQWRISDIRLKCSMYTSYIYIVKNGTNVGYKNPHCALCNFESLENMNCGIHIITRIVNRTRFSFTFLLDINRSGGDIVGQVGYCDWKSIWDPKFKKCRPYTCAMPGYILKGGKCTPP